MSKTAFLPIEFKVVVLGALLVLGSQFWSETNLRAQTDASANRTAVALEGHWRCLGMESDGEKSARWSVEAGQMRLTVTGNSLVLSGVIEAENACTFSFPGSPEGAIDLRVQLPDGQGIVFLGIVSVDRDNLRLAIAFDHERPRPTSFETRPGDSHHVFTFQRTKPGEVYLETAADKLRAILIEGWQVRPLSSEKAEQLSARCLTIAESNPGTDEAAVSLLWVLANAPESESAQLALDLLRNDGIAGASLESLAQCFGLRRETIGPGAIPARFNLELASLLLDRVRRSPDDPKSAEILSSVCLLHFGTPDTAEVPPTFYAAATMIADHWTTSPNLIHFLEAVSNFRQRPWAGQYEATLRTILAQNPDAFMRYYAAYTLAQLVAEAGEDRQEEARQLFVQFVESYRPGVVGPKLEGITEDIVAMAKRELDAMLVRGLGRPAPDLRGTDLDGRPLALREYRGKVVLLSFWATWCGPCMKLIPHERELIEKLKDRPFALLGVNGDDPDKLDRKLMDEHGITWQSFQDDCLDGKTISGEWNVAGWPTLYLIDHNGTIRRSWHGAPPLEELDHEVEKWVAVAEGKPLPPAIQAGSAATNPAAKE